MTVAAGDDLLANITASIDGIVVDRSVNLGQVALVIATVIEVRQLNVIDDEQPIILQEDEEAVLLADDEPQVIVTDDEPVISLKEDEKQIGI